MTSKILTALALIALLGVAACGDDTEPDQAPAEPGMEQAGPGQQMDPETMAMMMEVQELQQRLAPIQEQAMQDEELAARLTALQEQVETAMREAGPELFAQMEELEADFTAAQEAGNDERVQEIGMEAQAVQMQLQSLQQDVLDRPDIREPIDAFEDAQRAKMIEIDPEAGEIMDRIEEIFESMGTP